MVESEFSRVTCVSSYFGKKVCARVEIVPTDVVQQKTMSVENIPRIGKNTETDKNKVSKDQFL